jgi:hypothetical protein
VFIFGDQESELAITAEGTRVQCHVLQADARLRGKRRGGVTLDGDIRLLGSRGARDKIDWN